MLKFKELKKGKLYEATNNWVTFKYVNNRIRPVIIEPKGIIFIYYLKDNNVCFLYKNNHCQAASLDYGLPLKRI